MAEFEPTSTAPPPPDTTKKPENGVETAETTERLIDTPERVEEPLMTPEQVEELKDETNEETVLEDFLFYSTMKDADNASTFWKDLCKDIQVKKLFRDDDSERTALLEEIHQFLDPDTKEERYAIPPEFDGDLDQSDYLEITRRGDLHYLQQMIDASHSVAEIQETARTHFVQMLENGSWANLIDDDETGTSGLSFEQAIAETAASEEANAPLAHSIESLQAQPVAETNVFGGNQDHSTKIAGSKQIRRAGNGAGGGKGQVQRAGLAALVKGK